MKGVMKGFIFFLKMQSTGGNRGKDQSGLSLPVLSSRMWPWERGCGLKPGGPALGLHGQRGQRASQMCLLIPAPAGSVHSHRTRSREGEARFYWRKRPFQHLGKASMHPGLEAGGQHASPGRARDPAEDTSLGNSFPAAPGPPRG